MSSAATTSVSLHAQLRVVALRLLARQALRAIVTAMLAGSVTALAGVLLLVALPLALGAAFESAPLWVLALAIFGFVAGLVAALRRTRVPGVTDAALALEARLGDDDGALATALQLANTDRFHQPVLKRAGEALSRALRLPAPHVLTTSSLVLAPLLLLAATTALVWALGVDVPAGPGTRPDAAADTAFSINVQSGRDAADAGARAEAMGLQKAAAAMNKAAQLMRSESATHEQRQGALDEAKRAGEAAADTQVQQGAAGLPQTAPSSPEDRQALATRLENLAMGAGEKAGEKAGDKGGTGDSGKEGEVGSGTVEQRFVPFPVVKRSAAESTSELASQTPERRDFAKRALAALEK
ncbi:MAG: hypothetical protein IPK87_04875 [Planctomycetes bacterium]|nr:hypothetical protein [Planctomycetota bacterium]